MKKYGKFEFDEKSELNLFDQIISLYIHYIDDLKYADTELEKSYFTSRITETQQELLSLKTKLTDKVVKEFLEEKKKLCQHLQKDPDLKLVEETGLLSKFDLVVFSDRIPQIATKEIESINAVQKFFDKSKNDASSNLSK